MKQRAVAQLEQRKLALISGIWSNEGFNDDKGTREQALTDIETKFQEAERVIWLGEKERQKQLDQHRFTKADEENPFLRPAIEATRALDAPLKEESASKVVKAVQDEIEIDQE